MNKTIVSIAAALGLGASSLSAQQLPFDYSLTSDMTFASEYVFRGLKQTDSAFQPSIEVSVLDAYLGLWSNFPYRHSHENEVNLYGGYEFAIDQMPMLSFDLGGTLYYFPSSDVRRSHEFYAGANFRDIGVIEGLSAGVYFFHDMDIKSNILEGYVGYSVPLDQFGGMAFPASVDLGAHLGAAGGNKGFDSYNYYGFSAEVPFRLTELATLTAGVHYADAWNQGDDRGFRGNTDNSLFGTVSLTMGF
ncbi:MAG: TorF family putative porin [Opitutales bacterium]